MTNLSSIYLSTNPNSIFCFSSNPYYIVDSPITLSMPILVVLRTRVLIIKQNLFNSIKVRTLSYKYELQPWWITGFCDAESSFSMFISKTKNTVIGWSISPCFNITLHIRDLELLKKIQIFFGPKDRRWEYTNFK